MIPGETYNILKARYSDRIKNLTIEEIRIGLHLCAAGLSDGSVGVSATFEDNHPFCARSKRDFGDFTPLNFRGQRVEDLFRSEKENNILCSVRLAVLNAISSEIISSGLYKVIEDCDPLELVSVTSDRTVTIVGAFHSYVRKLSETGCRLHVLELNENALPEEFRKFYVPAGGYEDVVCQSDLVIITGQTLANGTIEGLLGAVVPGSTVIVAGPSGSILPDVLFSNGVNIIGATRITGKDVLFDLVSEGASGYHLIKYCAKKICILRNDEAPAE